MPRSTRFVPGTVVGECVLVRRIADGGMGEVHEATSPWGHVAVKLVTWGGMRGTEALARFLREGALLRELSHPGIVKVLAHGVDVRTKIPYLVLELLEGDDLDVVVGRRGPLAPELVASLGVEVTLALGHAHERGVVHRDVKPANVIVPRDPARGRAILCDFGLSKRVGAEGSITGTGALLGTPYFMAPEQVLDSKHADVRSDVFSLAMTLYFAVTGKNPFESLEGPELVRAVCSHPVPDVRTFRRDVPEALAVALAHALHRDARARATLDELRGALREIAEGAAGVPEAQASRAGRGGPTSRPRGLAELDTLELQRGSYSVMRSMGSNLVEAVNDEGQVVRIERLGPLAERQKNELFRELELIVGNANDALVAVVDHGEAFGEHYVVSESFEDPALATYVDTRGPFTMDRGLRAVSRFVRGYAKVSAAGFVHGAIGPSTLSLRATNTKRILVLSDIGIARRIHALGAGTAKRAEDPRVDVLGVVAALHFAVVGQLPFGAQGAVADGAAARPLAVTFAAPEPSVLRALEALVRRAIRGEIPTFEALGHELRALADETRAG